MGDIKIEKAIYKPEQGKKKEVYVNSLTRKSYQRKYKGNLFCPEEDCNARIAFQMRKRTKFFKSIDLDEHECKYKSKKNRKSTKIRNKSKKKFNISDEHINNKLRDAYNQFSDNDTAETRSKNTYEVEEDNTPSTQSADQAALFKKGEKTRNSREPYILTRQHNNIKDEDINEVRCVIGEVDSMIFKDDHAYINFVYEEESERSKVYFSDKLKRKNENEFKKLFYPSIYVSFLIDNDYEVDCCCVGKIKKVNSGYNIEPDRAKAFFINGLTLDDIAKKYE